MHNCLINIYVCLVPQAPIGTNSLRISILQHISTRFSSTLQHLTIKLNGSVSHHSLHKLSETFLPRVMLFSKTQAVSVD